MNFKKKLRLRAWLSNLSKVITYLFLSFFLLTQTSCASSYKDQRKRSPYFDGDVFKNEVKQKTKSFFTFLWVRLKTPWSTWPEWVESTSHELAKDSISQTELHVTHINHSTVLLQTHNYNILTDPIFSERCSPVSWAGPKRVRHPGLKFKTLPKIDIILISHDHYDHLDLPTLEKLIERDNPYIITGLGVGRHIKKREKVIELDWWEAAPLPSNFENIKVHFTRVQHFSGRTLLDRNSTQWGGFHIQLNNKNIYFAGDTGFGPHFQQTFEKYGPMDFSIIPVGAYEPRSFMKAMHVNPEEAVLAHQILKSKISLGVHYGTFQLTAEKIDDPITELKLALEKLRVPEDSFITPEFGRTVKILL